METRRVALLSPHFPPATLAGVHRVRHLAKHLSAFGWEPIVIRADERHYTERLDPDLAALVPSTVEQIRTGAVPANLARRFGIGDIGLRGYTAFRSALHNLASRRSIDAVLITGSPFFPMLLARYIREKLKVPVVLDFQDPWVSAEGGEAPRWSKRWLSHQMAVVLEPRVVEHADFITSVSDRQNDEMAARYPWINRERMAAIPIGGDPADFDALRANPPLNPQVRLSPNKINLSYVGTFLPRAAPLVHALFSGLRLLREREPAVARRMQLHFVGTSNQPSGAGSHLVTPLAAEVGVADLVKETPQRVPYLEALSLLSRSDGLIMIGSDEPHYTASKIYPNLMARRPFISIFHSASSAHTILSAAGGGVAFAFDDADELPRLTGAIAETLEKLATHPASFGNSDPAAYEPYTAQNVARQFAASLERTIQQRVNL